MQLHIYKDKNGVIFRTDLFDKINIINTPVSIILEGEYASIKGKTYSLQYFDYFDGGDFDQFMYELSEVDILRDLNFIFEN